MDGFGDRARVALVRKGSQPIGGLIALASGNALTVPWASYLSEHVSLCPNMLLYWETIRAACRDGFGRFDFGRSTRGSGTYRFKRQWGAEEQPIFWYTIPVKPGSDQGRASSSEAGARAGSGRGLADAFVGVWSRLPLGLTRAVGPRVRKYLIQ